MSQAIAMIELNSIARGIETADFMAKAAQVQILRASTVCPGKYMVIIGGQTGEVTASLEVGLKQGEAYVVDYLKIPNVHPQLIPAIALTNPVETRGALGVLEFYSVASAIKAADTAVKAANVTLIEVRTGFAIGGKGFVTLTGDVGAVRAAVEAASHQSELLVSTAVIPRPSKDVFDSLL